MQAKTPGGSTGMNMILYPDDAKKFLKWGALGFIGLGAYQLFMTVAKRNINPSVEFTDPVESMNHDPIIRDSFIHIQPYRKLNPWLYKSALQNVDQLLFLENALLSQEVSPVRNDKVAAWSHFRMGVNRLNQFQFLVRERMGNDHGMAVNLFVRKIYDQMKKHALNILHLCSEFKPENLIARAPFEVERALKNYEEGREPENPEAKWERLRTKIERRKARKERKQRDEAEHVEDEAEHKSRKSRRSRRSRRSHHSRSSRPSAGLKDPPVPVTPARDTTAENDKGAGLGSESDKLP